MDFRYVVFPGAIKLKSDYLVLHNKVFLSWSNFWTEVLNSLDQNTTLNNSDFLRQTYIAAILNKYDDVAGVHLYSVFHLSSLACLSHSYFTDNYHFDFVGAMKRRNISTVMSMEYLTVLPSYRTKYIGWSMAQALVGLGHRLQKELNIDAAVAPCRCDLKVDQLASSFGAEVLTEPGVYNGISTVNMISLSANLKEPKELTSIIEPLWANKWMPGTPSWEASEELRLAS